MAKNTFNWRVISIVITVAVASLICVVVFGSVFADNTIDLFSFLAALFLIGEGFYKVYRFKNEPYFPNQLIRHIRIIIGTCIFTIHIMQCIYGT